MEHLENFGSDETWISVTEGHYITAEDQFDSILELFVFFLVELICLGFFPYQTERPTTNAGNDVSDAGDSDREDDSDRDQTSETMDEEGNTNEELLARAGRSSDERAMARDGASNESGEVTTGGADDSSDVQVVATPSNTDEEVRAMVPNLAKESILMHRNIAEQLLQLSSCSHGHRVQTYWICSKCRKRVWKDVDCVVLKNPVLG